jgi:hypothetical protein
MTMRQAPLEPAFAKTASPVGLASRTRLKGGAIPDRSRLALDRRNAETSSGGAE